MLTLFVVALVLFAVETRSGNHGAGSAGLGPKPVKTPVSTPPSGLPATAQVPRSVPSANVVNLTASCGNPQPSATLGPAPTLPAHPTSTLLSPSGGVVDFVVAAGRIYVETPSTLVIATLQGHQVGSFALPVELRSTALNISALAAGPDGDLYMAGYQSGVVDKLSPAGRVLWSERITHPTGLFSVGSNRSFRIAVTPQLGHQSDLLTSAGQHVGTTPVTAVDGTYVTEEAGGDLLVSTGGQVKVMNPSGTRLLHEFGSLRIEGNDLHTGGPYQFYYPGQAVQAADGTILTADPLGTMEASSSAGILQATTTLGGTLALGSGYLYRAGSELYFESGPAFSPNTSISSVPVATLDAYLAAPRPALDRLGWGAGLSTPAAGNYFPAGTIPSVRASFAPWWAETATHLRLTYSVWNAADLAAQAPPGRTVSLPATAVRLSHIGLAIPRADRAPGPYAVQASLYDTSSSTPTLLGSTCLPFTVGAPGDKLDLGRLPPGLDSGGAADARGIELNAELGLNGLRSITHVDWATFLPNCNASSPNAGTCGPGAMTLSHAPSTWLHAAGEAQRDGVTYWVQITGGDPVSAALAHGGWWQADIEKLVAYYNHPPPGCGGCAAVTRWEPWNEPNDTGWSNGSDYVKDVLAPFYRGVKAADPNDTVIGGSTLEVPSAWWAQLIKAGGLHDLDVAGVHPYPGNNDSLQEWGMIAPVQRLKAELGRTPLWFTELGWWGDGDFNVGNQAADVAQTMIEMRALDVPVWNYYYAEGAGAPGSISFSLIQTSSAQDDYVKAAALSAMAAAGQLEDRPYLSMPSSGIPSTYEARFGPAPGHATGLTAVWSDGLATTAEIRLTSDDTSPVPLTVIDEWGGATRMQLQPGRSYALPVSSLVTYLTYPAGDQLNIGPTEPYGPDLAASVAGGHAKASSGPAAAAISQSITGGAAAGTGWSSDPGNKSPVLSVNLGGEPTVNRVLVDTQSVGSTATGLRTYTVSLQAPDGHWSVVARVAAQYRNHQQQLDFPAQRARAVRITVAAINYGGYDGGGIPSFWASNQPGVAFVHAIEIYGGSDPPSTVEGRGLTALS
jgi:hypothetical protein